jgi:regulator of replication initiation timing
MDRYNAPAMLLAELQQLQVTIADLTGRVTTIGNRNLELRVENERLRSRLAALELSRPLAERV